MKYISVLVIVLVTLSSFICYADPAALEIFVAVAGNDNGTGEISQPFKTLEKARDKIRAYKTANGLDREIKVILRGGEYNFSNSFQLTSADSGSAAFPITYTAYENEIVTITGSSILNFSDFGEITDTNILNKLNGNTNIKKYALPPDFNCGEATYLSEVPGAELYSSGMPLNLARWPNKGEYASLGKITANSPNIIFQADARCANWANVPDAYIVAMWQYDWASSALKISQIDTQSNNVTMVGKDVYTATYGQRYFAHNILAELDEPGEYYIDRENKILYYFPLDENAELRLTVLNQPLIQGNNLVNVNFKNLNFAYSRNCGLDIDGYTSGKIENCRFYSLGSKGAKITNALNSEISGCEFTKTGREGVYLSGGNTFTLTPGNNIIQNSIFHGCSRLMETGPGGIALHGVANKIYACVINDMPKEAIVFKGNEHEIYYNEIYDVCKNSDDCGAVNNGNSLVERGVKIKYNYFHDIHGVFGNGAHCVYLDDMLSGNYVENNIFSKSASGVFIHGGRDNEVKNNLFYDCYTAIRIDTNSHINESAYNNMNNGYWIQSVYSVRFNQEPYLSRYPQLRLLLWDSDPFYPKNNSVTGNTVYNGEIQKSPEAAEYSVFSDNVIKWRAVYHTS